jgi:type II secretory pathway component PulJ
MTLVEVLAALALLSMLIAATSSLTGYIARVSAERQAEATVRSALGATVDLIAADLDAWSAAHAAIDQGESDRPSVVTTTDGVEIRFPAEEGQPTRIIVYRFDQPAGRLTRDDSADPIDQPRDVMGDLAAFDVSATEISRSGEDQVLLVEILATEGIGRSVTAYLPPVEGSDG